jgi:hypothetical protein
MVYIHLMGEGIITKSQRIMLYTNLSIQAVKIWNNFERILRGT